MNLWTSFLGFFSDVFSGSTGEIIDSIQDIALEVVESLDDIAEMNGAQKKEEAFKRIEARAKAEGKKFASHAINLVIELAVAKKRK